MGPLLSTFTLPFCISLTGILRSVLWLNLQSHSFILSLNNQKLMLIWILLNYQTFIEGPGCRTNIVHQNMVTALPKRVKCILFNSELSVLSSAQKGLCVQTSRILERGGEGVAWPVYRMDNQLKSEVVGVRENDRMCKVLQTILSILLFTSKSYRKPLIL